MLNKLQKLLVTIFALLIVGTSAGAGSSIATIIMSNLRTDVTGNTDALLTNIDADAEAAVTLAIGAVVDHNLNRANAEIQAYYNYALEQLGTHPAVLELMQQVGPDTTALIAEEKARIDAMVAALLGQ